MLKVTIEGILWNFPCLTIFDSQKWNIYMIHPNSKLCGEFENVCLVSFYTFFCFYELGSKEQ